MLIEIIVDLPVESNNHKLLATFHSNTPSIIDTMRLMSLFGVIAQTSNRIPLNMFGSRLSVTLQISFVVKFEKFDIKSLRFLAVKVLYLTVCKI